MTIDFGLVMQAVAPLALAAMTASIPYALTLLQRLLKLNLTSHQVAVITQAADHGAEAAYGFMVGQGATLAHVDIKNAAVARGVNHVLKSVPDALAQLGITPEQVQAMVEARFGGLIARHQPLSPPAPVIHALAAPDAPSALPAPSNERTAP